MGKKLYVGNLPFGATEENIQELFKQVGNVESAKIIVDRDTGRSKGFGFVELSSDDEARQAIDKFNGYEFEGRTLRVSEAHDRPAGGGGGNRSFGGGGGSRGGGHRPPRSGPKGW